MIGEAVRRMLAPETDIDFRYCSDPTKAIEMAAEFHPTVILQDLVMPEVDGLTMLRFYRANPATREIPTIVLSTKEEPKVKAEAFTLRRERLPREAAGSDRADRANSPSLARLHRANRAD